MQAYVDRRTAALAVGYGVAGWAAFTTLLVAAGDVLVPPSTQPFAPAIVVALAVVTGLAVGVITRDFFRRAGRDDTVAALVLGTALAAVGLALDAALLVASGFRYPNVAATRQETLGAALLLGYAVAAALPPLLAVRRAANPAVAERDA